MKLYVIDKEKCYDALNDFTAITLKNISDKTNINYANVKNKKSGTQKVIEYTNTLLNEKYYNSDYYHFY